MNRVSRIVSHLLFDPANFYETRYNLIDDGGPLHLGSLSLGYSNNSIKIYVTKMIGKDGCFDWNLSDLIATIRGAITRGEFTPEFAAMLQCLSNEMVPGLTYDFSKVHLSLRPHISGIKLGFSLMMVTTFDLISNDKENISNLQYLVENYGKLLPLSSFVFRRFNHAVGIGEIESDLFISISPNSNVFIQFIVKFLFNPSALSSSGMEAINQLNNDASNGGLLNANVADNSNGENNYSLNNNSNNNNSRQSEVNGTVDANANRTKHERKDECEVNEMNETNEAVERNENVDVSDDNEKGKYIIVNENGEEQNDEKFNTIIGKQHTPWIKNRWKMVSAAAVAIAMGLASTQNIPTLNAPL